MRLIAVIVVIFLMIAAVGQSLYWVTTRSEIQRAWSESSSRNQVSHRRGDESSRGFQIQSQRRSAKAPSLASSDPSPRSTPDKAADKTERPPLKFKKVRVMGRMASPRLDFTQESLPVERVDEPVRQEFFQKVFAPVGDYSF